MIIKGETGYDNTALNAFLDWDAGFEISPFPARNGFIVEGSIESFKEWASKEGVSWRWVSN